MTSQIGYLDQWVNWATNKRNSFFKNLPLDNRDLLFEQEEVYRKDNDRFSLNVKYEAASVAKSVGTLALAPFAFGHELYRMCSSSIGVVQTAKNIISIPAHVGSAIHDLASSLLSLPQKLVTAVPTGVGFLAWHGGEKLVRQSPHTVLSNNLHVRDIVYNSVGLTLLSAAAVCVPVRVIQLLALPIIIGSVYGTVNNQFTIRECPEYYTMGHHYDGTHLRDHAIKTNNLIIKPIITGCYATTCVTPLMGVALSAVGTVTGMPVREAALIIGGITAGSLVISHLVSTAAKARIQKAFAEYEATTGVKLDENLMLNVNKVPKSLEYKALKNSSMFIKQMPIKYIAGWEANNARNGTGYLAATVGTVGLVILKLWGQKIVI